MSLRAWLAPDAIICQYCEIDFHHAELNSDDDRATAMVPQRPVAFDAGDRQPAHWER
jgi:hypothetical protein